MTYLDLFASSPCEKWRSKGERAAVIKGLELEWSNHKRGLISHESHQQMSMSSNLEMLYDIGQEHI